MRSPRNRPLDNDEVLWLLAEEPELLAVADAVASTQRPSRRPHPRRPLVVAAVIAIVAAALFLVAPWQGERGLLERANAALGVFPVVHLVLETESPDNALVEIATGRAHPQTTTIELWYDEDRDLLRVSVRRGGVSVGEILETPDRAVSSAGPVEQDVGVTLEPAIVALAADYREALAAGIARPLGDGVLAGAPVRWLEIPTRFGTTDHVALDRETLLPVVLRSPGSGPRARDWTVQTVETIRLTDGVFSPPPEKEPTAPGGEVVASNPVSPGDAAAGLGRVPLWAGAEIDGLELALIRRERLSRYDAPGAATGARLRDGLMLLYGAHRGETPDRDRTFVELRQATAAEPAYGWLVGALALEPLPPSGFMVVEYRPGTPNALWIGRLRRGGLYVSITAPSRELVLETARSLTPLSATP